MASECGAAPPRRIRADGEPRRRRATGDSGGAGVAARRWMEVDPGSESHPGDSPGRGPTGPTPGSDSLSVSPPGGFDREVRQGVPLGGPLSDLPGPSPEPFTPTRVFDRVVGPASGPRPRHQPRAEPGRPINLTPTGVLPWYPAFPPPELSPGAVQARARGDDRPRQGPQEAPGDAPSPRDGKMAVGRPSRPPAASWALQRNPPVSCLRRLLCLPLEGVGPVKIAAEGISAAPAVVSFHPGRGRMESRNPDLGSPTSCACPDCTAAGAQ